MHDLDSPEPPKLADKMPVHLRMVEWFSTAKRPGVIFAILLTALFLPSLFQPFLLDDFRAMEFFKSYESGERESLDLYLLVKNPEQAEQDRLTNYSPWWIFEDFHIRYFRPVSELVLYGQYRIFGNWVTGYRIVGLLLYIASVILAYKLYCSWLEDESLARWSALLFALAASNAVPVIFVTAQCDLLALFCCLEAMLLITRFIKGEGIVWLLIGLCFYVVGIGSKEAALPSCALPLALVPILYRKHRDQLKPYLARVGVATSLLLLMALGFVAYYSREHYGSNGILMINPLRDPLTYLKMMPVNVLMLLSAWILQANPIFTYFHAPRMAVIVGFCLVGAACMIALGVILRKRSPKHIGLPAFGLWALVYMPLLACNNPDNRVLMLPMVGLAVILGVWLTGRTGTDPAEKTEPVKRVRALPAFFFIVWAAGILLLNCWGLGLFEMKAAQVLRETSAEFDRPVTAEDTVFFVNSPWQLDMLWTQYRADFGLGEDAPRFRFLTHLKNAKWERQNDHTLRITAASIPYFQSYLARVGMTQETVPVGMRFQAGEFTATIAELNEKQQVVAVDFEFLKPLDSDSYRFFELSPLNEPRQIDWNSKAKSD